MSRVRPGPGTHHIVPERLASQNEYHRVKRTVEDGEEVVEGILNIRSRPQSTRTSRVQVVIHPDHYKSRAGDYEEEGECEDCAHYVPVPLLHSARESWFSVQTPHEHTTAEETQSGGEHVRDDNQDGVYHAVIHSGVKVL